MTKPIPTIQRYMTTAPLSVGLSQTLAYAETIMSREHIRHLPVLEGGKLRGILSDRDIHLVETLEGVDAKKVTVEEAMSEHVYAVSPEAPLDEVVAVMAERKYGSAVVMQNEKVVGIFTTVDVCRAFGELLHGRLAK